MFGSLTEKFQDLTTKLSRTRKLTEENTAEAVKVVRLALLDADVNYSIVSQFVKRVKAKALGEEKIKGANAGDQFTSIVHDELVALMGGGEAKLNLKKHPSKILLCGLQGSGKTTHAAKLAYHLKEELGKNPALVALDLQRPAAVEQLKILGDKINVPVIFIDGENNPVKVAKEALKSDSYDVLIFDSAGRLHIDDELMKQLIRVRDCVEPDEVLFVANAASGQDAVKTAAEFDEKIGITGSILTMLDGTTRAGAALSIREVTKKPLLFEGIGERVEDLQVFNPESMADRILGMGDVINLVKKAKSQFDEDENAKMEEKFRKANFTYGDYLKQMAGIKKMGSLKGILKMLPGMEGALDLDESEKDFAQMEAIILSMTTDERDGVSELIPSRRRRLASGSGTNIGDVNRMVKGFKQLKKMAKSMPSLKKKFNKIDMMKGVPKNFPLKGN